MKVILLFIVIDVLICFGLFGLYLIVTVEVDGKGEATHRPIVVYVGHLLVCLEFNMKTFS